MLIKQAFLIAVFINIRLYEDRDIYFSNFFENFLLIKILKKVKADCTTETLTATVPSSNQINIISG